MHIHHAKSGRRPSRQMRLRRRVLPVLIAGCFGSGAAIANPLGGQVVGGQASFSTQGNTLLVTNTPGAIINWQSFSIGQGEVTRFVQQSQDSAVLNRIIGQDPSQILGALQSNGRVFLVNPNGILFGQGAQVDVNGFVASTLNISNDDFINGRMIFNAGDKAAGIKNEGRIATPSGGMVYLVAPNVENTGIIVSPQGQVMLAAGRSVNLVDSVNPALQVVVSAPDDKAVNLGDIVTQGGAAGIFGALVRQGGVVSADSAVVGENGKIFFRASKSVTVDAGSMTSANGGSGGSITVQGDGTTLVSGDVQARGADGKGGQIRILGKQVGVIDHASIDASGTIGGGTVLVGGDYQGKGTVPNADVTYTGAQTSLRADATGNGDGGKVVVWADDTTRAYGIISVRGGEQGGDGGFVETSGKKFLDVGNAFPDVRAPKGKAGSWLLDPENITIAAAADSNIGPGPIFAPSASGSSVLSAATLTSYLQTNGSATVDTTNPLYATGTGAGDITVNAAIAPNMSTAGSLTLFAAHDININAPITATGNALDIRLSANTGGTGSGAVNINSALNGNGGSVEAQGSTVSLGAAGSINGGWVVLANNQADGTVSLAGGSSVTATSTYGSVGFNADNVNLEGTVTASGAAGYGSVFFNPYTASRAIDLGTKTSGKLSLTAAELQRISSNELSVSNGSGGGDITVSAPLAFGPSGPQHFSISSYGNIAINAPVSLAADSASIYLNTMGTTGGIDVGAAGGLSVAGSGAYIGLSADRMNLGGANGSINAGAGAVAINPYSSTTSIHLGQGATDGPGVLGLSDNELKSIATSGMLEIGNLGDSAGMSVVGALDLSTSGLTGELFLFSGIGGTTINQGFKVPNSLAIFTAGKLTNNGNIQAGNDITLFADKMALDSGTISNTSGSVWLMSSNPIDLGASNANDSATGRLELNNAELNSITTQKLRIFNVSSSLGSGTAGIDVKSAISPMHIGESMTLYSAGGITQQAGATISGAPALSLIGTYVDLPEANFTGVVSGAATEGSFRYRSSNLLTVSNVDGIHGIALAGATEYTGMPPSIGSISDPYENTVSMPATTTSTALATSASITLMSDSTLGINQNGGSGIYTNGGTLILKTPGPVQLYSTLNNIDRVAADLSAGTAGSGQFALYSASDLEVVGTSTGVSGIRTNNSEIHLATGPDRTLTVSSAVNAGAGDIDLEADNLTLAGSVTGSEASIRPFSAGRAMTIGSATCAIAPCLRVTNLYQVAAQTIGLGREPGADPGAPEIGPIHVAGITHTGTNAPTDRNDVTTRIGLLTASNVTQSGAIDVHDLGVVAGGSVELTNPGNAVTDLVAKTSGGRFAFSNAGAFNVSSLTGDDYGLYGIVTNGGDVALANSSGDIQLVSNIEAGTGNVAINAGGALTKAGGTVAANQITVAARSGIALSSKAKIVSAVNTDTTGSSAIVIDNIGPMALYDVQQLGTGSGGITVTNQGALTLASGRQVRTGSGGISLTAKSPLTIDGAVSSVSGAIALEAGASNSTADILTVNGAVSTAGSVTLKAGSLIVTNNNVTGSPVIQAPNGNTPTVPSIDVCVATPSLPQCAPVSQTVQTVNTQTSSVTTTVVASTTTTTSTGTTGTKTTTGSGTSSTGSTTASAADGGDEKQGEGNETAVSNDSGAKKNEPSKKMYCN